MRVRCAHCAHYRNTSCGMSGTTTHYCCRDGRILSNADEPRHCSKFEKREDPQKK